MMVQISQNTWKWRRPYVDSNGVWLRPNKISKKAKFLRYQPTILNTTCSDFWLWFFSRKE